MIDLLNYGFAWFAVLLAVILAVVYITRKISQKRLDKNSAVALINRSLRKPHKTLGVLLIMAGLVHGLASSQTVWSLNYGTIAWLISILLGLNFLFRGQLKFIGGWLIYHRILTVVFLFSIVWHIIDVGGIRVFDVIAQGSQPQNTVMAEKKASESAQQFFTKDPSSSFEAPSSDASADTAPKSASPSAAQQDAQPSSASDFQFDGVTLKDGSYTGSADGYGPNLTVTVTVQNGRVTNVEIVSHNERNSRYYAAPMQIIPEEIVQNQSVDVDTVSGATYTSIGIKNAVLDALKSAVLSGQLPEPQALPMMRRH